MKVRALKKVFAAGRLQSPGDIFAVGEVSFNPTVMEKVADDAEVTRPVKPRVVDAPLPESGTVGIKKDTNFIANESKMMAPSVGLAPKKTVRKTARKTRARKKA
jgi:hypothetical protein